MATARQRLLKVRSNRAAETCALRCRRRDRSCWPWERWRLLWDVVHTAGGDGADCRRHRVVSWCSCGVGGWALGRAAGPQEYKEATKHKSVETGITLIPNENNLFLWKALLKVVSGIGCVGGCGWQRLPAGAGEGGQQPCTARGPCACRVPLLCFLRTIETCISCKHTWQRGSWSCPCCCCGAALTRAVHRVRAGTATAGAQGHAL